MQAYNVISRPYGDSKTEAQDQLSRPCVSPPGWRPTFFHQWRSTAILIQRIEPAGPSAHRPGCTKAPASSPSGSGHWTVVAANGNASAWFQQRSPIPTVRQSVVVGTTSTSTQGQHYQRQELGSPLEAKAAAAAVLVCKGVSRNHGRPQPTCSTGCPSSAPATVTAAPGCHCGTEPQEAAGSSAA